jgi:MOSC domain-containing protein YiiM
MGGVNAFVVGVSRDPGHNFSKPAVGSIRVIEGKGVEGDAHAGTTVQHLHPKRLDPAQPNLRQVHLIQSELHDELREHGYDLKPGDLGENVTTRGVDLLALPRGTQLRLGPDVVLEITGLRNPCSQINGLRRGLLKQVVNTDSDGTVIRKTGVMSVVLAGGLVHPDDPITLTLPTGPHTPLGVV